MGGFFGVTSKSDCVFDLFFGTDYHSHLGTKRGGMAVYGEKGFQRAIHNIENSPFRTKFERDVDEMKGMAGIGCISDTEPQPLIVRSHLGNYAITTVGRINNMEELVNECFTAGASQFLEMSGGSISPTELTAALINRKDSIPEGIRYAQSKIQGSMSLLVLTPQGLYAARDLMGRTPVIIGEKDGARCASFESSAYLNLGYTNNKELGPGEVVFMTPDSVTTMMEPLKEMKICTFLWVYYGYPTSEYEGVSVETMRYQCGEHMARRDGLTPDDADMVAGVPDSGTPHAVGYANESGIPFKRPFIKYTPTWPRSFMPTIQSKRDMIARMKLIPITELIENQRLVLIDDSIVRGTQLHNKTEFLKESGAAQVHVRSACPPIMFGCKYLNFSRSTSELELIARRMVQKVEGENVDRSILEQYADPSTDRYAHMLDMIREQLNFDSLAYNRLDDMIDSVGIDPDKLCTYCWNGVE